MNPLILLSFLILFILFSILYIHLRKKSAIRRVCTMSIHEKLRKLSSITEPFGFDYIFTQDVFTSNQNAWQRDYGYCYLYDKHARHLNMVIDCEPIYFDYEGRTWLIEFWKGQYGITTGGEIGIYKADTIIPKNQRKKAYFHCVTDEERLFFSFTLRRGLLPVCRLFETHWWLTGFLVGQYTEPELLSMNISITFPSCDMCCAFIRGMNEAGYPCSSLCINGCTVSFLFCLPYAKQPRHRFPLYSRWVQWKNRRLLSLFLLATKPFCFNLDRLILLYEYLPCLFRHLLRIRKCKKRRH